MDLYSGQAASPLPQPLLLMSIKQFLRLSYIDKFQSGFIFPILHMNYNNLYIVRLGYWGWLAYGVGEAVGLMSKNKFNMISVTSPQQILNSPLNTSPAKYHWSFGKANRFKTKKSECEAIYNIPTTRSKRSSSFGSGKRVSFCLTTDSPSPMTYTMNSSFNQIVKGTSFGKNRQECKEQGYILTGPIKNPGPGTYEDHKDKGLRYSLRPKTAYPSDYFINDKQKTLTPGPGTYQQTINIDSNGCMTSKIRNANRTTLSFRQKRFRSSKTIVPGPGYYDDRNHMKKDGQYMLSTNRSDGTRPFLQDKRQLRLDGNKYTPGPGFYRMPSDFGHYQKVPYDTIDGSFSKSRRPMTARK